MFTMNLILDKIRTCTTRPPKSHQKNGNHKSITNSGKWRTVPRNHIDSNNVYIPCWSKYRKIFLKSSICRSTRSLNQKHSLSHYSFMFNHYWLRRMFTITFWPFFRGGGWGSIVVVLWGGWFSTFGGGWFGWRRGSQVYYFAFSFGRGSWGWHWRIVMVVAWINWHPLSTTSIINSILKCFGIWWLVIGLWPKQNCSLSHRALEIS